MERQRARGGALVGAQLVDTEREGVAYIVNQLQLAFRSHVQRYYGNLALLSHWSLSILSICRSIQLPSYLSDR